MTRHENEVYILTKTGIAKGVLKGIQYTLNPSRPGENSKTFYVNVAKGCLPETAKAIDILREYSLEIDCRLTRSSQN